MPHGYGSEDNSKISGISFGFGTSKVNYLSDTNYAEQIKANKDKELKTTSAFTFAEKYAGGGGYNS